jgi:hypothetical protein
MPTALQPPANRRDIEVDGLREWYKPRFEELVDELFRPGVPIMSEEEQDCHPARRGGGVIFQVAPAGGEFDIDDIRGWVGVGGLHFDGHGLTRLDKDVQRQLRDLCGHVWSGGDPLGTTRPRLYLEGYAFKLRVTIWVDVLVLAPESK